MKRFDDGVFVRPSYRRMKVIRETLEEFGRFGTEDLVRYTKESFACHGVSRNAV